MTDKSLPDSTAPAGPVRWRLVLSPPGGAAWNMAVDEALMESYRAGEALPTLRLYTWRPPALSIGVAQHLMEEVDLEACARLGVDYVRRPTGGRAVLHDAEVTYSVVTSEEDPLVRGTIVESYRSISAAIVRGLSRLGVSAEMAPGKPGPPSASPAAPQGLNAACFEAPSEYEVVVEGRKLVGSAQTRRRGVLLQHGSLLLDFDALRLCSLLRYGSEEQRRRSATLLARRVTSLKALLGRLPSFDEIAEALRSGFEATLGLSLCTEGLSTHEEGLAAELETKYASVEWNFRL